MLKNKIVFFSMGGTILCTQTPQGLKPTQSAQQIVESALTPEKLKNIQLIEYHKIDSAHLDLKDLLNLHQFISKAKTEQNIRSLVLLMGTDNLEHAAFFLSLLSDPQSQPLILTGAIIPSGEKNSDAIINIRDAHAIAQHTPENKGLVLVAFNRKIYSALDIRKFQTDSLNAFIATSSLTKQNNLPLLIEEKARFKETTKIHFPKIRTVRVSPGEDASAIGDAVKAGCEVIIIEGLGKGNINPQTKIEIEKYSEHVIFIVTSQALFGNAEPVYESAKNISEWGVLFSGHLSTGKTLILCSLLLAQKKIKNLNLLEKRKALKTAFDLIS